MQKLFYIVSFFLVVATFSAIMPYPVFSNLTNINEQNTFEINNFHESEMLCQSNQEPQILPLTFNAANLLLNENIEIFDLETGLNFFVIRTGGLHHFDVEPIDGENAKVLKKICANQNWQRRPVLVKASEFAFIPASISAYPHGFATLTNNHFNGHICLHFKDSKMDGTQKQDSNHQKCVEKAQKIGKNFIKTLEDNI